MQTYGLPFFPLLLQTEAPQIFQWITAHFPRHHLDGHAGFHYINHHTEALLRIKLPRGSYAVKQ